MPKTITKATLTLNPIKLVIEQIESPSSTFPAAPVINAEGIEVPEPRPLARVIPFASKLKRFA